MQKLPLDFSTRKKKHNASLLFTQTTTFRFIPPQNIEADPS